MVTEPESMQDLIYMTNRELQGGKGSVRAWVYKATCSECKKGKMGKPRDEKTGKPKIRATEYVCLECGHSEAKAEHEESLQCEIMYQCPHCSTEGEIEIPFKRKNIQLLDPETGKKKAAKALQFACKKCSEKINITKKMKE